MNTFQSGILDKMRLRVEYLSDDDYTWTIKFSKSSGFTFQSEEYFDYQDKGVKGTEVNQNTSATPYKYGTKMPPPSSFTRYTKDRGAQFAIAKSIQRKGIKGKNYIRKFNEDPVMSKLITEFYQIQILNDTKT